MNARKWVPIAVVGLAAVLVVAKAVPPSPPSAGPDLNAFGRIPVQYQGRFMPLDTVARHHLLVISGGRETYTSGRDTEPAIRWMLEVMSGKDGAVNHKVIRIDSPDVRQFLRLENRPGSWRYSPAEVSERLAKQSADVRKIMQKAENDKPLTDFEKAVLTTSGHVRTIVAIRQLSFPGLVPDPDNPAVWLSPRDADRLNEKQYEARARREAAESLERMLRDDAHELEATRRKLGPEEFAARVEEVKEQATFKRLQELLDEHRKEFAPQSAAFHQILKAYADGRPELFNAAVKEYHEKYVTPLKGTEAGRTSLEFFLNRFDPFFLCQWMYVGVMVLAAIYWMVGGQTLNNTATALGILALVVHTGALVLRVVVSEKPPVTNLYSSAVFIGWGGLILCLGLDLYYRNGLGNFVGGLIGMGTMLVARFLEANGDTMPRVEAVLNTNFWLSCHVTLVTLGYMATFVAGKLAIVYILMGFFSRKLSADRGRSLYGMIYGVTCFATLLSFVGTVLGGFWADDSWGRFWGWDPKENGAVLIVIWNVLNLHLRWAGIVKARGFAIMAVLGNVVTAWSWFGTNQLGIGLHAYGFDDKLATGCMVYWLSQFLVVALALAPLKYWASFGEAPPART